MNFDLGIHFMGFMSDANSTLNDTIAFLVVGIMVKDKKYDSLTLNS